MKVDIRIETDSIEEGRRMLRGLEALLSVGSVQVGGTPFAPPAGMAVPSPAVPTDMGEKAPPADAGPQPEAPKRTRRTKEQIAADEAAKAAQEAQEAQEAAPATEPAQAVKPATEQPAEAPAKESTAEAAEPVTHESLRKVMNKLASLVGVQLAMAELQKTGHGKVKDIPEDKLENAGLLLGSAVAKAEAAAAAKAAA